MSKQRLLLGGGGGYMRLKMVSHRDALAYVEHKFGTNGLQKLIESLNDNDKEIATVHSKVINSWVDVDVHVRLLTAIVNELNHKEDKILLETGEWIAMKQLNTIYRAFLVVVSPEFMLKRSSTIFHTFYDEGAMEVNVLAPGKVDCIFKGFAKPQQPIELSITGWFTGAAKLSRAKNIKLDITTSLNENKGYFKVLFTYNK
jgi:hypothetical protein